MMLVFVSYARENSEFVLRLAQQLKENNIPIWLDQFDIQKGERWDRAIEAALDQATHILLVLSQASVDSENVRDEVDYAIDEGKQLVPILIEDCKIPLRVRRHQHIDFRLNYATAFETLVSTLPTSKPQDNPPNMNEFLADLEIEEASSPVSEIEEDYILVVEDTKELLGIIEETLDNTLAN